MPSSKVRTPALEILADGVVVPGAMEVRVVNSASSRAGRFQASFAYHAAPEGYWSGWQPARIEVRAGSDGAANSIFLGVADCLAVDLVEGLVEVEGRDLTALLIDTLVEDSFPNQAASDIAQQLAGQVGLVPVVTQTSGLVGRYWNSDYAKLALGNYGRVRSAWDILVQLAVQEEFSVYVVGEQLFFVPIDPAAAPVAVIYPGRCIKISVDRSLRIAGDIEILVRSWNSRTRQGCAAGAVVTGTGGAGWKKILVRPNLLASDAQLIANHAAWEMASHERVVRFSRPGEGGLAVRAVITLAGSGLDFDQNYVIDEIEREISVTGGFIEHVRARSASAGRVVSLAGGE